MVWSEVFMLLILLARKDWRWVSEVRLNRKLFLSYLIVAVLISCNWFLYIWAVNNGFIVETSLGYFINPLINVLLGFFFLSERPRMLQWLAIALAATGVAYLTFVYGELPWISLFLAVSFAFYGLIKKHLQLGPLRGMTIETALLLLPAVGYLVFVEVKGTGALGHFSLKTDLLLVLAGVATGLPLLLFAAAAKNLSLTVLGIMQYIAPSIQFLLGVFVYNESFSTNQWVGFSFIWLALIIFTFEGLGRQHFGQRLKDHPSAR